MNETAEPAARRDKLHGRRRGRKLRPGQQSLLDSGLAGCRIPPSALADLRPFSLFDPAPEEIWLEIGAGAGEHAAGQAMAHPAVGLIACEVFEPGIAILLGRIARDGIRNLRLFADDARLVLDALPDASLGRAFILFPDPWPKRRHHKRRLVSAATMAALSRVLADGAELRLATDDVAYLRVMLELACGHADFRWLARRPEDWRNRPADWPETRYEAKAIAAGRRPAFLRLERRSRV